MRGHGARRCPVDGELLIEDRIDPFHRDVVVDACARCHGMFLDKGELLALTGNKELQRRFHKAQVDRDSAHDCPGCGRTMDAEEAGDALIDVCLTCKGIWLDGGELERLQEMQGDGAPEGLQRAGIVERVFGRLL